MDEQTSLLFIAFASFYPCKCQDFNTMRSYTPENRASNHVKNGNNNAMLCGWRSC